MCKLTEFFSFLKVCICIICSHFKLISPRLVLVRGKRFDVNEHFSHVALMRLAEACNYKMLLYFHLQLAVVTRIYLCEFALLLCGN